MPENWYNYINTLNAYLKGSEQLKEMMQQEIDRIQAHHTFAALSNAIGAVNNAINKYIEGNGKLEDVENVINNYLSQITISKQGKTTTINSLNDVQKLIKGNFMNHSWETELKPALQQIKQCKNELDALQTDVNKLVEAFNNYNKKLNEQQLRISIDAVKAHLDKMKIPKDLQKFFNSPRFDLLNKIITQTQELIDDSENLLQGKATKKEVQTTISKINVNNLEFSYNAQQMVLTTIKPQLLVIRQVEGTKLNLKLSTLGGAGFSCQYDIMDIVGSIITGENAYLTDPILAGQIQEAFRDIFNKKKLEERFNLKIQGDKLILNLKQAQILSVEAINIYREIVVKFWSNKLAGKHEFTNIQAIIERQLEQRLKNSAYEESLSTIFEQITPSKERAKIIEKYMEETKKQLTIDASDFDQVIPLILQELSSSIDCRIIYASGEQESIMDFINNNIAAFLGGNSKNPTNDFFAGSIHLSFVSNRQYKPNLHAKIAINRVKNIAHSQGVSINEKDIKDATKFASKITQTLDYISKNSFSHLDATKDFESFRKNTEQLREMRNKEYQLLASAARIIGENNPQMKRYNIHGTAKGYERAKNQTFEGASFGSNLKEQINILSNATYLTDFQLNDNIEKQLTWSIINMNSPQYPSQSSNDLKKYFTSFLIQFMFNDAKLNIQDTISFMKKSRNKYYDEIHIYGLNREYYPQSYVLQATYERLQSTLADVTSDFEGTAANGAYVRFEGAYSAKSFEQKYNTKFKGLKDPQLQDYPGNEYPKNYKVKLKLQILGGFLKSLQALSEAFSI